MGVMSAFNCSAVNPSALNQSATTSLPPVLNNLNAFWKKSSLFGKWLIASEIQTQSKLADSGEVEKKSPIFSASSSTNRTEPSPSLLASPVTSIYSNWSSIASKVNFLAISTCFPLIVTPMTLHAWLMARYRLVPPMPQPTSRTELLDGNSDLSSRSWINWTWATSLGSLGLRKYPWWICSPLISQPKRSRVGGGERTKENSSSRTPAHNDVWYGLWERWTKWTVPALEHCTCYPHLLASPPSSRRQIQLR